MVHLWYYPILYMRKLRFKEIRLFAQDHSFENSESHITHPASRSPASPNSHFNRKYLFLWMRRNFQLELQSSLILKSVILSFEDFRSYHLKTFHVPLNKFPLKQMFFFTSSFENRIYSILLYIELSPSHPVSC